MYVWLFFLIGCSNEESIAESSSETIVRPSGSFKHKQQEFEIINYYQEFLDFLKLMESFLEENPGLSIEEWTNMSENEIFYHSKFNVE